ncbi:MAG: TetR family transcriptional regulator [Actinomycetales bacterium]|nr:TetR family transcriptional regulator [Actinomycetales bacterium]
MRSAQQRPGAAPADDATSRARIRDAAIRRFGAEGFGVGLRAIAADAGVSPALVLHHFGSKEGLRRACDEHVLAVIAEVKARSVTAAGPEMVMTQMAEIEQYAPLVAYQLRSVLAGGEMAKALLEDFMASARTWVADGVAAGTLRPSRDEEARVRYLTLSGYGGILGWMALDPPEDFGDLGPWLRRYMEGVGLPIMELFTEGLFTDRRMLDAYLSYVSDPPADEAQRSA